jgi:hypothetical protein
MLVVAHTPSNQLLPFERVVIEAVSTVLDAQSKLLLSRQVEAINFVQRPLDWKVIEFYCKRWLRGVCWPEAILFPRREDHLLAEVQCRFGAVETTIAVRAVDGHIFSLAAPVGMSGLSISGPFSLIAVRAGT